MSENFKKLLKTSKRQTATNQRTQGQERGPSGINLLFRYHEKMIFKKLERWSPRFLSSELGRKIKGTPSIFSPGCKDFVLQYVDKAQNFEKRGIFAS